MAKAKKRSFNVSDFLDKMDGGAGPCRRFARKGRFSPRESRVTTHGSYHRFVRGVSTPSLAGLRPQRDAAPLI